MFKHGFDEKTKNRIQNVAAGGSGAFVGTQATKKYWMPHAKSALKEYHKATAHHTSVKSGDKAFKRAAKHYGKGSAVMLGSALGGAAIGKGALEVIKRYSNKSNS